MGTEPDVMEFATTEDLWRWLADHHETHPGGWVRLQRSKSNHPSVSFHDLLEAGIAFGWSESTRRANDRTTYLQRFAPRRTRGTTSARNRSIAARLNGRGPDDPCRPSRLSARRSRRTERTRLIPRLGGLGSADGQEFAAAASTAEFGDVAPLGDALLDHPVPGDLSSDHGQALGLGTLV